jgi:hypothetical protein
MVDSVMGQDNKRIINLLFYLDKINFIEVSLWRVICSIMGFMKCAFLRNTIRYIK